VRIEREVDLPAAPERVWEVVMDPRRLADWVAIHAWVRNAPPGRLEAGSRLRQGFRLAGLPFEVRWTVTRAERPSAAEWEGAGPVGSRARVEYGLTPAGDGTRFRYVNELALPGGPLALRAAPVVAAEAGREVDETLRRLAALLEREGSATP
jgi:uncharacterized protein YndB with AHSA1/START domain